MLPKYEEDFEADFQESVIPSKDYALNREEKVVNSYVEGIEEIKQAVYLILSTEKYEHEIYSQDYGFEKADLFGEPIEFVEPEVERRIEEALLADDRIDSVSDFEFEVSKGKLHVTFTVVTTEGMEFEAESEVEI